MKNDKTLFDGGVFEGERALYNTHGARIANAVFQNGESPLKESSELEISGSVFKWKYPLWYSKNVTLSDSTLLDTARSGIWYTENISVKNSSIEAPKTFRRSSKIYLENTTLSRADETLWNCREVVLKNVFARGDYFAMNTENVTAENFSLDGNYAFDGAKNVTVRNAKLISKDAFWNAENIEVYDSVIIGEYLGWNSKNVRFVNCTIESNQGLCYMDKVELVNCTLINTDLAFELSDVNADIISDVVSVKNPKSGKITAKSIGEIILDKEMIDPEKTEITVNE